MPRPKLNSLNDLLSGQTALGKLEAHAQALATLRSAVQSVLPASLAPWCLGAEIEARTLTLYLAGASAATAVRYRQADLLASLSRRLGQPLERLETRIMPDPPQPPAPPAPPRTLPGAVRQLLQQTARQISEPGLALSLKNLGRYRSGS